MNPNRKVITYRGRGESTRQKRSMDPTSPGGGVGRWPESARSACAGDTRCGRGIHTHDGRLSPHLITGDSLAAREVDRSARRPQGKLCS